MVQYTHLDPASPARSTILATYFISQSVPDIRKEFKRTKEGPKIPIQELVKMAFKVFNAQQEATEPSQQVRVQQKAKLQDHTLALP